MLACSSSKVLKSKNYSTANVIFPALELHRAIPILQPIYYIIHQKKKKNNHRSAGREGMMLVFSENLKNGNYYSTECDFQKPRGFSSCTEQ